MNKISKQMVKGSPEYTLTDAAGKVMARSHCVHVGMGRFTLVIGGKFAGMGSEAVVVDKLQAMCA